MEQAEIDLKLVEFLRDQGYRSVIPVAGRGLCAVQYGLFDEWDLVYGLNWWGVTGRYGYDGLYQALVGLWTWDGTGDPYGNWAVHKGQGFKIKNPLYVPGV